MKILCVDYDNPYGPTPGGQFQETKRTIFPLAQDHELLILTAGSVPKKQELAARYLGLPISIGRQFDFIRQARRYVATHNDYDIVLEKFTSPVGPIGLPGLTDKPVIGIANFMFWAEMSSKYHLPFSWLSHHLLRRYRWVACYDVAQADQLRDINPKIEPVLIPATIGSLPKRNEELGQTILFIGRPDIHQKGLDLLAKILTNVQLTDAKVVIAGGVKSLTNYTGNLPLEFVGYLDDQQKSEAFRDARLLVMPSRYESFGLVQLEAAAYGKPTVAFDLPTFRSRSMAMALVPQFDVQAFARQIEKLWNDPKHYTQLSHASQAFAAMRLADDNKQPLAEAIKRIVNVTHPA